MIEKAYAKINISLNIIGKRADGYHELDMIMVPVSLYDTIYILLGSNTGILCLLLDLKSLLICTCQEHNIIALHTAIACYGITGYCRITMTDVRISRRIINRGRDVKFFIHSSHSLL